MKETKCDAVKLEGGKKIIPIVKRLIKNKNHFDEKMVIILNFFKLV